MLTGVTIRRAGAGDRPVIWLPHSQKETVEAFVGRIDLGGAFRFPSVVEEILGTSPGRISQADFGPAHVDVAYVESRHLKDAGFAGVRNMKPRIRRHHFIKSASKRIDASASRFE